MDQSKLLYIYMHTVHTISPTSKVLQDVRRHSRDYSEIEMCVLGGLGGRGVVGGGRGKAEWGLEQK